MGDVGLLLIATTLLVNGVGLLGRVPARSGAPLNLMVGAAQVVLPTIGLILDHSDPAAPARYAPIYLFGFTYLWVGIDALRGDSGKAFGIFSGFVAAVAVIEGLLSLRTDPAFAASWFLWALMWGGFLLLDGLDVSRIGAASLPAALGWLLILGGMVSAAIPGLLRMEGLWFAGATWFVSLIFSAAVLTVVLSWALGRMGVGVATSEAEPAEVPAA